jgi:hypothetical protein
MKANISFEKAIRKINKSTFVVGVPKKLIDKGRVKIGVDYEFRIYPIQE